MTICDRCKSMDAKALLVTVSIKCVPTFDGATLEGHRLDLCRACYDQLMYFIVGKGFDAVSLANQKCDRRHSSKE